GRRSDALARKPLPDNVDQPSIAAKTGGLGARDRARKERAILLRSLIEGRIDPIDRKMNEDLDEATPAAQSRALQGRSERFSQAHPQPPRIAPQSFSPRFAAGPKAPRRQSH